MEEHFILRVPPSVAERLNKVLNENPQAEDASIDLSFKDTRTGTFSIGKDEFDVSLMDLPAVVESYKTYDDTVLIKGADIGQMIIVREPGQAAAEGVEHKDGLTPAMRDARKRRFRRDTDINPDYIHQVENDLQNILAGGTARDVDVELVEQEEDIEEEVEAVAEPEPAVQKEPQVAKQIEPATAKDDDDSSDDDANGYYEDSDEY